MKTVFSVKIFFSCVVFLLIAFSCSKDDMDYPTCDVSIEGVSFYQEEEGGGLKATTNVGRNGAPDDIDGYTVTARNIAYPSKVVSETYKFKKNGNAGILRGITVGDNEFTAISYGGEDRSKNEWESIDFIGYGTDENALTQYQNILKNTYPIYTIYKAVTTKYINANSGVDNSVFLDMRPANGRLAIVMEYYSDNRGYIRVVINGKQSQKIYNRKAACYILNDGSNESTDVDIKIDYYHKNNKYYKTKHFSDVRYEIGKNNTRLVMVEDD